MGRQRISIVAAVRGSGAGTGCFRARRLAATVLAGISCSVLTGLAVTAPAAAQGGANGRSYLTPFPKNDVYELHVFGDYYADDLASALAKTLKSERRIRVRKDHRAVKAIIRSNFKKVVKRHINALAIDPAHIAVVMIGGDDRGSIRFPDRDKIRRGDDEWKREYARRVDTFIKALKKRGAAVYWVGLPIMRRQRVDDFAKLITGIIRERAYLNGVRFIDAYSVFVDENGEYDSKGPDLNGEFRRLRDSDGETFTWAGNLKLAHFVEREIKRDMVQVKLERSVPLAGSEADQRRINPGRRVATKKAGWTSKVKANIAGRKRGSRRSRGRTARSRTGGQKAQNSRIKLQVKGANGKRRTISVTILRPSIPASIIELVTRKLSADRPARLGDDVPGILRGGMTVLSTITPAGDTRRHALPTQAPYYRALIKGERLPPEPGRADDVRWPRPGMSAPGGSPRS